MNQFRAKRVDNNQWVFGDRVQGASGKMYIFDYDDINHTDLGIYEVIPETVCQFIGLTDVNVEKVFCGDKIKYLGAIGVVYYESDTAMFMVRFELNRSIRSFDSIDEEFEVIGNIHESEVSNG